MTQRRRVKLSANQRMDMWGRWKAGQSLHQIGRAFGKEHVSIQFMLSQHGGIVPATPSALAAHAYTGGERGHWEGDLLGGTKNSHIATRVERHSRFTTLVKVPSKDTTALVAARSRHVRKLPASLRRSLTRDRGLEMAKHKSFTVATNVKVYLCDPQSPWQRGTN